MIMIIILIIIVQQEEGVEGDIPVELDASKDAHEAREPKQSREVEDPPGLDPCGAMVRVDREDNESVL